MSLPEQVGIFRGADIIVGMAGSAFHTLALTPHTEAKRIIFTYGRHINSNFTLIDEFASRPSSCFTLAKEVGKGESRRFTETFYEKISIVWPIRLFRSQKSMGNNARSQICTVHFWLSFAWESGVFAPEAPNGITAAVCGRHGTAPARPFPEGSFRALFVSFVNWTVERRPCGSSIDPCCLAPVCDGSGLP